MNMFRQIDDGTGSERMEAVGGAGLGDVIRVGDEAPSQRRRLITVGCVCMQVHHDHLPDGFTSTRTDRL